MSVLEFSCLCRGEAANPVPNMLRAIWGHHPVCDLQALPASAGVDPTVSVCQHGQAPLQEQEQRIWAPGSASNKVEVKKRGVKAWERAGRHGAPHLHPASPRSRSATGRDASAESEAPPGADVHRPSLPQPHRVELLVVAAERA